jgi:hypothetical protein
MFYGVYRYAMLGIRTIEPQHVAASAPFLQREFPWEERTPATKPAFPTYRKSLAGCTASIRLHGQSRDEKRQRVACENADDAGGPAIDDAPFSTRGYTKLLFSCSLFPLPPPDPPPPSCVPLPRYIYVYTCPPFFEAEERWPDKCSCILANGERQKPLQVSATHIPC